MSKNKIEQPLGRILSIIGKKYLYSLNHSLNKLEIERNYYALLLIESAKGKITQQELACLLEIDKVSMLRSIDYLSEKGYINRVKNQEDKRKYSLLLTEKAKKALPEIKKAFKDINTIALCGLKESQIAEFMTSLKIIKNNLNKYTSSL